MNQHTIVSGQSRYENGKEICSKRRQRLLKRLLDVVVSVLVLAVIWPFLLLISLWIRFDSPGPVLFRQTRVGLGGKPYKIFKFRTMILNADTLMQAKLAGVEDLENFIFQEKNDPRITRSGKFLRKRSLDELPQLLNVLIGNMSLVGPRPEVPEIVKLYTPEQYTRLDVPPGVTGLAQINGRSELTLGETLAYDLEYVRKWSLWLDIKILWETVIVVLTGRGAY
ncbi:MAG TPA: sugar transferase [Desulfitobacteriaceae bacterium]|nr:sugar transferase [Desulfitobacteriaceae bacterium]